MVELARRCFLSLNKSKESKYTFYVLLDGNFFCKIFADTEGEAITMFNKIDTSCAILDDGGYIINV